MGTTQLTEEDLKRVTVQDMPGGRYTAVSNGDTTWNIIDVPVFSVVLRGEKSAPHDIREEWMEKALAKGIEREKGGEYWGPVHVGHHGEPKPTAHAGYLKFRRMGTITYEGETLPAIYANFLRVPEAIFKEIEEGRLGYVSVEIASWTDPEIASVALMADETPFFRLPLLTTGDKLVAQEPVRIPFEKTIPSVAYRPTLRASNKAFILFNLGPAKTDAKENQVNLKEEHAKAKATLEAAFAAFVKLDGGAAGGSGGGGGAPGDAGGGDAEGDGGDVAFYFAMMEYAAKKLKGMGKKFMAPGQSTEEEVKEAGEKENKRAKPAEVSPKASAEVANMNAEELQKIVDQAVEKAVVKTEAKFAARIDAADSRFAAIDEEKRIKGLVDKAVSDLSGWYLSADTLKRIDRFARADKDGAVLSEYVADYKLKVLREPPTGGRRGAPANAPAARDPEAVAKFANSPEDYAKVKKLQADYELAKQTGHTSLSLDRFIEIGLKLPARQMAQPEESAQAQPMNVR